MAQVFSGRSPRCRSRSGHRRRPVGSSPRPRRRPTAIPCRRAACPSCSSSSKTCRSTGLTRPERIASTAPSSGRPSSRRPRRSSVWTRTRRVKPAKRPGSFSWRTVSAGSLAPFRPSSARSSRTLRRIWRNNSSRERPRTWPGRRPRPSSVPASGIWRPRRTNPLPGSCNRAAVRACPTSRRRCSRAPAGSKQ